MDATKRAELKALYRAEAKKQQERGDMALRQQAAISWRELATRKEIERAPKYLRRHN